MPIASPEAYADMIDRAKAGGFAYPAINVTSSQTLNAALQGLSDAESDGIVQVSVGGASYLSGQRVGDRVVGSLALAAFAHEVAVRYPITVALHTDHCNEKALATWVRPLLAHETEQVARGEEPAFQSHMWDGSALPLGRNLEIARELLEASQASHTILEIEAGVVGGEEDGVRARSDAKLYSTQEDGLAVVRALGAGERGRYLTALTFGNVHGVYKPGNVHLRPELLGTIQDAVAREVGRPAPLDLVFHGGSGSAPSEVAEAVRHGVVKMNIDTDTQYAFTRPVANHMLRQYDGVLHIDGDVGRKADYDPRAWGRAAEDGMAARVVHAAQVLGSAGRAAR